MLVAMLPEERSPYAVLEELNNFIIGCLFISGLGALYCVGR